MQPYRYCKICEPTRSHPRPERIIFQLLKNSKNIYLQETSYWLGNYKLLIKIKKLGFTVFKIGVNNASGLEESLTKLGPHTAEAECTGISCLDECGWRV